MWPKRTESAAPCTVTLRSAYNRARMVGPFFIVIGSVCLVLGWRIRVAADDATLHGVSARSTKWRCLILGVGALLIGFRLILMDQ